MTIADLELKILANVAAARRRQVMALLDQLRDDVFEEAARVADAQKAGNVAAALRMRKRSAP